MNKPSAIPIPMHAEGTEKKITKKSVRTLGHVLEDMYTKRMVYSSTYLQSSL